MPVHIEIDGLPMELPDITQAQLETFLRAERDLRAQASEQSEGLLLTVCESIRDVVRAVQQRQVSATGADYAALVERTARQIITAATRACMTSDLSETERVGIYARAAARLGWLPGVTEAQIGEWRPGRVAAVVERLAEAIAEARTVPKN